MLPEDSLLNIMKITSLFTDNLPGEPNKENICRQVYGACYSEMMSRKCQTPKLIAWSDETAAVLWIILDDYTKKEWAEIFSGN